MRVARRRLILLSLPLLVAAAPLPPVPAYRSFGQWVVGCDNTRSCEARGFDEPQQVDMRVLRGAGDAGARIVLMTADVPENGTVHVDGRALHLAAPAWVRHGGDPSDPARLSTDDPTAIRVFLAAVRNGHVLQLGGPDAPTIPLDGLRATLLFIDAVQARPGTTSPLVAPAGTGQAPPAPPLPRPPSWLPPTPLTPAETLALVAQAKRLPFPHDETCDRTEDVEIHALGAASALAIRPCVLYAYQGSALVHVLPRKGGGPAVPVVLPLPGMSRDGETVAGPSMISPEFDPKTGRLAVTEEARGPGDCGLVAEWAWGAAAFHMTSLRFLDRCGDVEPGDFPTLYRSAGGG